MQEETINELEGKKKGKKETRARPFVNQVRQRTLSHLTMLQIALDCLCIKSPQSLLRRIPKGSVPKKVHVAPVQPRAVVRPVLPLGWPLSGLVLIRRQRQVNNLWRWPFGAGRPCSARCRRRGCLETIRGRDRRPLLRGSRRRHLGRSAAAAPADETDFRDLQLVIIAVGLDAAIAKRRCGSAGLAASLPVVILGLQVPSPIGLNRHRLHILARVVQDVSNVSTSC